MFREHYMKVIGDKHDDVMAKFGAILAHGILDAGQKTTPLLERRFHLRESGILFRRSKCHGVPLDAQWADRYDVRRRSSRLHSILVLVSTQSVPVLVVLTDLFGDIE